MSANERDYVSGLPAEPRGGPGPKDENGAPAGGRGPTPGEGVGGLGRPAAGGNGKLRPVQVVVTGTARQPAREPSDDQRERYDSPAPRGPGEHDLHRGGATGGREEAGERDDATESGTIWFDDDDDIVAVDDRAIHDEHDDDPVRLPVLMPPRRRGKQTVKADEARSRKPSFTGAQRLLILDTWLRSKLPAKDFAPMVGVSSHTLYAWKKRFDEDGPAGLQDRPRGGPTGSRLPEATKRAIVMLKESHPDWGCERINDVLMRSEGYAASPGAINRVLKENGYVTEHVPTRPHPDKVRRFERAKPNQLWQTDLFTFVLKRQNRRVHLVGFMDDHSRFLVGFGLHATASGALVREVFESAMANHGAPQEVLTDNGPQYITWRGTSAFTKLLQRRGIRHVVARPKRPQTLGKIERFWGTLWRECLESAIFRDLDEARQRIGQFIDHYNFQRPHRGLDGLVPADRFYEAAP